MVVRKCDLARGKGWKSNRGLSLLRVLEKEEPGCSGGAEGLWRGAMGRGVPAGGKGGCTCWEMGLDSAHQSDENSLYTAFKPNEAKGAGAGVTKTYTENSHLVIHNPAFLL